MRKYTMDEWRHKRSTTTKSYHLGGLKSGSADPLVDHLHPSRHTVCGTQYMPPRRYRNEQKSKQRQDCRKDARILRETKLPHINTPPKSLTSLEMRMYVIHSDSVCSKAWQVTPNWVPSVKWASPGRSSTQPWRQMMMAEMCHTDQCHPKGSST